MRWTLCISLILVSASLVEAQTRLEGKLTMAANQLQLGEHTLSGDLVSDLSVLNGRTVVLEGQTGSDGFEVRRVVSPERTELTAVARQSRRGWVLEHEKDTRAAFGRTALLKKDHSATLDVWRLADGSLGVVAAEAETDVSWLILRSKPQKLSTPCGLIHGKSRAVWVSKVKDGYLRIRRGDQVGWVPLSWIRPWNTLVTADRPGIVDNLPE